MAIENKTKEEYEKAVATASSNLDPSNDQFEEDKNEALGEWYLDADAVNRADRRNQQRKIATGGNMFTLVLWFLFSIVLYILPKPEPSKRVYNIWVKSLFN